jgi:hypothetical protein
VYCDQLGRIFCFVVSGGASILILDTDRQTRTHTDNVALHLPPGAKVLNTPEIKSVSLNPIVEESENAYR